MKIHESAENYLETIYMLGKEKGNVRSIDIVNELGFTKPSVSIAQRNLRESGYINMDQITGFITLTEAGEGVAKKMYEDILFFLIFSLDSASVRKPHKRTHAA